MKLVIQNELAARVGEIRACSTPQQIDVLIEQIAEKISAVLGALRSQGAVTQVCETVEERLPEPVLQTQMLNAALSALSDGGTITDAHGLFVRRLSKSISARVGGAEL